MTNVLKSRGNTAVLVCTVIFAIAAISMPAVTHAQDDAATPPAVNQMAHDIFKQLVEINTTDSVGNVTTAAEAMAKRLLDAGFADKDVIVAGPNEKKKNVVVRFRSSGKRKPILFIGHLDVVEARREDWTTDPFQFVEKDGFFYGRGTNDMKAGDALLLTTFIRLKKEGYVPDRDLILALTADEEGGNFNGVEWLLKEHRDWVDAEYCINLDGGEFEQQNGKRLLAAMQGSEKVYADFQFESVNPGGHSSEPVRDNAIYHLAGALARLRDYDFPVKVNEITENYFARTAEISPGDSAADLKAVAKDPPDQAAAARLSREPYYNTLLRTTCVATMLSGGHAPNALPQTARANVNCRIFPGENPEDVRKTLERVAADSKVSVTLVPQLGADGKPVPTVTVPPSALLPEVVKAMEKTLNSTYPGVPLVATMSAGASDGKFTRTAGITTFGIACMFFELGDNRAHGKDERIGAQDFYDGVNFTYKLIRALSVSN
ncbi:MAG TPA: M20/M25/M40 family metallo-hydrolase [Verrucomicrobiae bacterium]|jgi:acetylornithine deacetylase/succinyl-diaminopimelate desuccinylase-like protein|nr:M20/M25/M40 family metallo-hydrolase [Verrucomicrobiae bacterium]